MDDAIGQLFPTVADVDLYFCVTDMQVCKKEKEKKYAVKPEMQRGHFRALESRSSLFSCCSDHGLPVEKGPRTSQMGQQNTLFALSRLHHGTYRTPCSCALFLCRAVAGGVALMQLEYCKDATFYYNSYDSTVEQQGRLSTTIQPT